MKYFFTLALLCLSIFIGKSQGILDQYVQDAINQNLSVREKQLIEKQYDFRIKAAGKQFGPEVNFMANYTLAAGGRSIEFPVGTLLNPVYARLNKIAESNDFPMVEDQTINFLPNNFHDVKLRISQPIFRPEIKYNKWIKEEEFNLAGLQTDQTIRELVMDVKTAYLRWMQAKEVITIMDQGLALLLENKRIAESLIRNGMAIPSARTRIESDIEILKAQKHKAQSDVTNAASYFNFLLHRSSDEIILEDSFSTTPEIPLIEDLSHREELLQIKKGERIQELALGLEEKYNAPRLGIQVDLGSQAYGVDWGGYVLGGVGLEIPIWDNKKSYLRKQEWKISLETNQVQYEHAKNAFEMQLQSEIESLRSDISIYNSYTSLLTSNERYYNETLKRYKEGLANYIELLDARTQVTNTQLQQNLAKYQSWIRMVSIERIAATTPIP